MSTYVEVMAIFNTGPSLFFCITESKIERDGWSFAFLGWLAFSLLHAGL